MSNDQQDDDRNTFLERMRAANPEGAALLDAHPEKQRIAMALRGMRASRRLTQKELRDRSGLSLRVISRMEAATGRLPSLLAIKRFADACGTAVALEFVYPDQAGNALGSGAQTRSTRAEL